jgi:hypothetical protein
MQKKPDLKQPVARPHIILVFFSLSFFLEIP